MAELLQKSGTKVWQRLAAIAALTATSSTVFYGIDGINLR